MSTPAAVTNTQLFDYSSVTIGLQQLSGAIDTSNGTSFQHCGPMPVQAGAHLTWTSPASAPLGDGEGLFGNAGYPCFQFASDSAFTTGVSSDTTNLTTAQNNSYTTTVPAGANYARCNFLADAGAPTVGHLSGGTIVTDLPIPIAPTITFAIPGHVVTDAPFTVSATSNSTGAFTYTVSTGNATISGNTITLTGTGAVVVHVAQAATSAFTAGTASATFAVTAAPGGGGGGGTTTGGSTANTGSGITQTQLNNAALDAASLSAIINGSVASSPVITRLGISIQTVSAAIAGIGGGGGGSTSGGSSVGQLSGKKMAIFGDSITAIFANQWQNVVTARTGLVQTFQDARPGRRIDQIFECYGAPSGGNITTNQGSVSTPNGNYANNGTPGNTLAQDLAACDICVIFLGTNDQGVINGGTYIGPGSTPTSGSTGSIGTLSDPSTALTEYGFIKRALETIIAAVPTMRVVIVTLYQTAASVMSAAQANQVATAYVQVAQLYAVPVINQLADSNIAFGNHAQTLVDGIHPTTLGFSKFVGPTISSGLQAKLG